MQTIKDIIFTIITLAVLVAILTGSVMLLGAEFTSGWIALSMWYVIFGFESAMNGAMKGGITMPFYYLWQDFLCNIPFYGKRHRLKLSGGDQEWADEFPGIIHFVLMHIAFPAAVYIGMMEVIRQVASYGN